MPVSVTQNAKVLDTDGELIYDADDDFDGCTTFEVEKVSGADVLVCCKGHHTEGDPEQGPFGTVTSGRKQWASRGRHKITKVWAKAASSTTTVHSEPLVRD